jgi:hypothetical protein
MPSAAYFREIIAPLLNDDNVEFVGEINERNKNKCFWVMLSGFFFQSIGPNRLVSS